MNFRGIYPPPLFHMESIWIPHGFHIIPDGFHTFHMEYVLAVIPLNLVIPFHLYSIWIPCGMAIFHSYSIIPYGISKWNPPGAVVEYNIYSTSIPSIPSGILMDSTWIPSIPHGVHLFHMDSTWIPHGFHIHRIYI
jgi:hypothetical protein